MTTTTLEDVLRDKEAVDLSDVRARYRELLAREPEALSDSDRAALLECGKSLKRNVAQMEQDRQTVRSMRGFLDRLEQAERDGLAEKHLNALAEYERVKKRCQAEVAEAYALARSLEGDRDSVTRAKMKLLWAAKDHAHLFDKPLAD